MNNYYTIKLDSEKQMWDVMKYTDIRGNSAVLITEKYTYNKSEIIKSSLPYNKAINLVTILNKLNG